MTGIGAAARAALLGLLGRAAGAPVPAGDRAALRQRIRHFGFRGAARAHLLRSLVAPSARDAVVLASALDGLFTLAVPAGDLGIGEELLRTGTYEPHLVALYRRRLRQGMTVVDVGANVGFHALHAAALVGPAGRVVAVEPDAGAAALLQLSLTLAGGRLRVEVLACALSRQDGVLTLSDLGSGPNSGARFTHADRAVLEPLVHGPAPRYETVRAVRWDSHHADLRLDWIKIDVEGHEPHAIEGMRAAIERDRPVVVSEFAPDNLRALGGIEPYAYVGWFRKRGYRTAIVGPRGEETPAGDDDLRRAIRGRHHLDLVFLP